MPFILDQKLKEYASPSQWAKLEALEKHGSHRAAAKAYGCTKSGITKALAAVTRRAAQHGYAPDHDLRNPVPSGFRVRGYSLLRDAASGEAKLIWEKAERDKEAHEAAVKAAIEAMCEDIPRTKPTKAPSINNEQLMSVIPWGDPHFGMYAHAAETGEDFNVDIAEQDLCNAVEYLVSQSPTSQRCVLINLGDFFHCDNLKNATSQSGNILDVDTRLSRVMRVGIRAIKTCIDAALKRHQTVEIINVIGNHDAVLALALPLMLMERYRDEPRVIIHDAPTPRHYIEHGKTLIGATHGDRTKDRDLPGIMATEMPEAWGRTRHRVFMRGHHHHDSIEMFNGCTVEQFSTLAPNDAWHNAGGYLTGRNMKLIAYHKDFGEMMRSTCSIDLVRTL